MSAQEAVALALVEDGDIEPLPTNRVELDGYIDRQLKRLAGVEQEKALNAAVAEAEIKAQTDWLEAENAALDRKAEYIRSLLRPAIAGYDFGDKKSRRLPHGTIGTKHTPAKLVVEDPAAVIQWAKDTDTPEFIRVKPAVEEVEKKAVNEYWASTGNAIPGTRVEEAGEKIIIEPAGVK